MQSTFFAGVSRRVKLGPPVMLIGANESREIKLPVRMPLTGEALRSMPDWLGDAFTAVSKHCLRLSPEVQIINDITVSFNAKAKETGELFDNPDARCFNAQLKKFEVMRCGDTEEPEVELHMALYTSFSREFWKWAGEMGGKEVHISFPGTVPAGSVQAAPAKPVKLPLGEAAGFVAERPELDPAFDRVFDASANSDMPADPSLEDSFGPEFEQGVRTSMGAPEPLSDKPRLVSVKSGDHSSRSRKHLQ